MSRSALWRGLNLQPLHVSPSCHEVVENDAVSLLLPLHRQGGAAAAKQQSGCSHLQVEERLAVEESCTSAVAHVAEGRKRDRKQTLRRDEGENIVMQNDNK